jgi:hypothetical protein
MKTTNLIKSIMTGLLLSGSTLLSVAQTTTPVCPLGNEPGCGRTLTPEQRAAQSAARQLVMAGLYARQAAGVLTLEEEAMLAQMGQRGGQCLTGAPRVGSGTAAATGARQGQGLRDGTGPRTTDCLQTAPLAPSKAQQRGRR